MTVPPTTGEGHVSLQALLGGRSELGRAVSLSGPGERPGPRRSAPDRSEPSSSSWLRENLEHGLPLLVGGAVCLVLAVWQDLSRLHEVGARLPLWLLLAAIGVVLVGGGFALTIVEEPEPSEASLPGREYLWVDRAEWERLHGGVFPVPPTGQAREQAPIPPGSPAAAAQGPTTQPLDRVPVDPMLVREVSDDLLRGPSAAAITAPTAVESTLAPEAAPWKESPGMPNGAGSPAEPELPRAARPLPTDLAAGAAPPTAPALPEDAIHEFESVLSQLGQDRGPRPLTVSRPDPAVASDKCLSCGTAVTAYSEQVCVACDRPLCDACLDRTAVEGHPTMCSSCHASMVG